MRNSSVFCNLLRFIYRCLSFLNSKWLGRWLLPHASCVLIENKQGQILAVSRKSDSDGWGLPGGKVEPHESDIWAAKRELKEETGIGVSWFCLRKIYEDIDDCEYWTTCYYACLTHTPEIVPEKITPKEQGQVKWVKRGVLTSGVFSEYNTKLFLTLDQIKFKSEQCMFCGVHHG